MDLVDFQSLTIETSSDEGGISNGTNVATNIAVPLNPSIERKCVTLSPESSSGDTRILTRKQQGSAADTTNSTKKCRARKRVSFKLQGGEEEEDGQLLSAIQSIVDMNLDDKDEIKTPKTLNHQETILEESMNLFWISNQRVKDERQRRKAMLESPRNSYRRSLSLSSQYLQNMPKLLNLKGCDSTSSEKEEEEGTGKEVLESFRTIQSNNIHNYRRHSHYE